MKKFLILFLIFFSCIPAASAKKQKVVIPQGSGYVGALPSLGETFQRPSTEEAKPDFEYQDGFNDPYQLKPIPRDNPSFINIIMKKDKTSQYINDLNSIITIVENLQTVIEEKDNIQKFNAQSYFLKENVDYFRNKYKDKSEESYVSFKKLMLLNTHVQAVAQLRLESEVYSPYVTAEGSGNMFTQNNIDSQLNYLLDEIKSTLIVLKGAR